MADTDHFRKLERMYHDSPCNDYYDPTLEIREGEATLTIPVDESMHHAAGGVHGATYFKALDDAAFFAVNSLVEDVFVLTANFSLYLTRPVAEGHVRAEGRIATRTGQQFIGESVVYDAEDTEIARGSGTFFRSDVELRPEIGYE